MFERYTERARRVIFFARYEASSFGSSEITSDHFLLALCRETALKEVLPVDSVRAEIRTRTAGTKTRVSTSLDLPLTSELKRVLAHAAEEATSQGSREIHCSHLALGLFREDRSTATRSLREHGLSPEQVKVLLEAELRRQGAPARMVSANASPHLLAQLFEESLPKLQEVSKAAQSRIISGLHQTRTQALGQLIEQAILMRRWLENPPPPLSPTVAEDASWEELVESWSQENQRILTGASRIATTDDRALVLNRLIDCYRVTLENVLIAIIAE